MAANSPIQTCFNAGELSPLISGRVDYQKYVNGCKTLQNFIPTVQGPVKNRPGLHFVAEVANSANRTWLVPFVFSETTAFILEFGPGYIRFYLQHGQLQSSGSPYQISTIYTASDLTNADGTFGLSFAQSGDVIYIATANQPPQKLIRVTNTNWTIGNVPFTNGPFQKVNPLNGTTITCSGSTGSVTLTASSAIFSPSDVGNQVYLQYPLNPGQALAQWQAGVSIAAGQIVFSGLNLYMNTASGGTSGNIQPIHTEGTRTDGNIQWQYLSSGYGNVTITGYTSPTVVTALVNPGNYIAASQPSSSNSITTLWAKAQWSATTGYPTAVTFFRGRTVWAQGTQLFFSVAADLENMATEDFGQVTDDMAIIINIASDRYDQIVWLAPVDVLLVGTVGSEYAVAEASSGTAFGPLNAQAKQQTGNGGRAVAPVVFNSSTLFVQRAGRKLREMRYSFATNNYQSIDLTVLSEHITQNQIVDMDFQQEPNYVVWCALANGQLVGLTYCREQDTVGWHEHVIGGGGLVECVSCIPTPDGTGDEMWCIVNITINGTAKRYICYLDQGWNTTQNPWDPFYLDLGATYNGINATGTTVTLTDNAGSPIWDYADPCTLTASSAIFSTSDVGGFVNMGVLGGSVRINITAYTSPTVVTGVIQGPVPVSLRNTPTTVWALAPLTISGLSYLQGQTVGILGDGAPQPTQVVSPSGTITMQYPASVVQVGLPYTSTLTTMRFSGGGQTGTGQGMLKRITHCIFRVLNTLGGQYGNDGGPYDAFQWRSSFNPMNQPPPFFTGDEKVEWNASTDFDGYVSIQQQQPLPMTVVAVMPQMFVNDPQT